MAAHVIIKQYKNKPYKHFSSENWQEAQKEFDNLRKRVINKGFKFDLCGCGCGEPGLEYTEMCVCCKEGDDVRFNGMNISVCWCYNDATAEILLQA